MAMSRIQAFKIATAHTNNGVRVPLVSKWGTALKMCRERKNFTHRDIAENCNVAVETVQLWELDAGVYPPSQKLARLHGMMRQLEAFKHLIPKAAIRDADARHAMTVKLGKAGAPPPPAPVDTASVITSSARESAAAAPGKAATFGDALRDARVARNLSQKELGVKIGSNQSMMSKIEAGRADGAIPLPVLEALLKEMPELGDAPPPNRVMRKMSSKRQVEFQMPGRQAEESQEEKSAPPASLEALADRAGDPPTSALAASEPLPPPAAETPVDQLGVQYARTVAELTRLDKRLEDAQLALMFAQEERDKFQKRAEELLAQIRKGAL